MAQVSLGQLDMAYLSRPSCPIRLTTAKSSWNNSLITIQYRITQERDNFIGSCLALGLNPLKLKVLRAAVSCNSSWPSLELSPIELFCGNLSSSELSCDEPAVESQP